MSVKKFLNNEFKEWHARAYFKLMKINGGVDVQLKKALKPYELTHVQLGILYTLINHHPEPLDAKTIKENLIVPSPDLTRLIDRLVKKGLVDRQTCPNNRRKLDITVTEKGVDTFYKAHISAKTSVNNFLEDDITKEEAKELFRILNKIKL